MSREELALGREYALKDVREAMGSAGEALGARALFSKRKEEIGREKLERMIQDEINKHLKVLSTLARYKNKDGTFGNRGTGKGGSDVLRYNGDIATELVRRVTAKIVIPKTPPVDFRRAWEQAALDALSAEIKSEEPPAS